MSARNGDKARFNNFRRRKLAKRQRVWAFFAAHPRTSTTAGAATPARAPAVAAAAPRSAQAPEPKAARPAPAQRPAAGTAPAPPNAAAGEKKPRVKAAGKQ